MTYPLGFRGDGVGGVLMFLRADELASSYSPSREGFARFRLLVSYRPLANHLYWPSLEHRLNVARQSRVRGLKFLDVFHRGRHLLPHMHRAVGFERGLLAREAHHPSHEPDEPEYLPHALEEERLSELPFST